MEIKSAVATLAALAHESRLGIFRALVVAGPAGITPGQLAERFAMAPATLSFHLKELSNAGLVTHVRESRHLFYSANFSLMNELITYLTDNCCAGQGCDVADTDGPCATGNCAPDMCDANDNAGDAHIDSDIDIIAGGSNDQAPVINGT